MSFSYPDARFAVYTFVVVYTSVRVMMVATLIQCQHRPWKVAHTFLILFSCVLVAAACLLAEKAARRKWLVLSVSVVCSVHFLLYRIAYVSTDCVPTASQLSIDAHIVTIPRSVCGRARAVSNVLGPRVAISYGVDARDYEDVHDMLRRHQIHTTIPYDDARNKMHLAGVMSVYKILHEAYTTSNAEWIVLFEDDVVPLFPHRFYESILPCALRADIVWMHTSAAMTVELFGDNLHGGGGGMAYRRGVVPLVLEWLNPAGVHMHRSMQRNLYTSASMDDMIGDLCRSGRVHCVASPLITELGVASSLGNDDVG